MNADLVLYYKVRAKEYEQIYSKPERQEDLLLAAQIIQKIFAGKTVFEMACGTGYWTERIAKTARSIIAIDVNDAVIEIAKTKNYLPAKVQFETADLYKLPEITKQESLFGGFIWSHIPMQALQHFTEVANTVVEEGGTIVFIDNTYVEGSSLPVTDTDSQGNTYQTRQLEDGTTHKVLKNFPAEAFIRYLLAAKASSIEFIHLHYYWILKYQVT